MEVNVVDPNVREVEITEQVVENAERNYVSFVARKIILKPKITMFL